MTGNTADTDITGTTAPTGIRACYCILAPSGIGIFASIAAIGVDDEEPRDGAVMAPSRI